MGIIKRGSFWVLPTKLIYPCTLSSLMLKKTNFSTFGFFSNVFRLEVLSFVMVLNILSCTWHHNVYFLHSVFVARKSALTAALLPGLGLWSETWDCSHELWTWLIKPHLLRLCSLCNLPIATTDWIVSEPSDVITITHFMYCECISQKVTELDCLEKVEKVFFYK